MKRYVDGYVLPVPKKNLRAYRKLAEKGGKIWKKHGALEYVECVSNDMKPMPGILPFPKMVKPKKGEVIVFSYVVFKSKSHRNKVNAKVMNDPQLSAGMDPKKMPFDCRRMAYGGFTTMVRR